MYTKTDTNKIHETHGVKFLQNKHCSVYETEQVLIDTSCDLNKHTIIKSTPTPKVVIDLKLTV